MEEKHRIIVLFALLLVFGYWSYLLVQPFLSYVLLGVILAVLFYPLYARMAKRTGESWAALLSIVITLLLIILPSIWLTASLVTQATNAYQLAVERNVGGAVFEQLQAWTAFDITQVYSDGMKAAQGAVTAALPGLISGTSGFLVGMVLLFFVFYYALKDGREWYVGISHVLPLKKQYKRRLQHDIESMTRALFYGQVLTAALIGIGCGLIFALFSIPNPVFWGFVMMVLAFLPLLGAPIVYVPAGIILMLRQQWVQGIAIIVLCTVVIFVIEYIVRPRFVSRTSQIHPLIVIIGALGGIYLLGFVGFLIGPLILGIFTTLLSFDYGFGE